MATTFFRFGAFRLDPQARELFEHDARIVLPLSTIDCLVYLVRHRDRPVGRDELASAVWGRVDVSEVSLSHAIMRLRRVLGDDGNAQRIIRTVPRFGYLWVMDDTQEFGVSSPDSSADTGSAPPRVREDDAVSVPSTPRRRRTSWAMALVAVVVAATLAGAWHRHRSGLPGAPVATTLPTGAAMVLPATVVATLEWGWLRLGLMDLVATRLRRGALATTSSETVVALVDALHGGALDRTRLPASVLIEPAVTLGDGRWTVQLAL